MTVDEPTVEETIEILRGIKERYEQHHKLEITDEALKAAAELASRYIPDRFLPDKAIDLIDEAASSGAPPEDGDPAVAQGGGARAGSRAAGEGVGDLAHSSTSWPPSCATARSSCASGSTSSRRAGRRRKAPTSRR